MVRRRLLRPVVMLSALFVLGGVTGVFGTLAFVQSRDARSLRAGPDGFDEHRLKGLTHRLDLDDAQRVQIKALLRKNREQMREASRTMFDECGAPVKAQREALDAEMRKLLRPDQVTRYDELQKERRGLFGPPGEGLPPPPPFP